MKINLASCNPLAVGFSYTVRATSTRKSCMPLLRTKTNYRFDVLGSPKSGDQIGVFLRDGSCRYYPWKGFIEVEDAKILKKRGARPVKLEVAAYSERDLDIGCHWVDLTESQAIQGCWFLESVFGVMANGSPRVVPRSAKAQR